MLNGRPIDIYSPLGDEPEDLPPAEAMPSAEAGSYPLPVPPPGGLTPANLQLPPGYLPYRPVLQERPGGNGRFDQGIVSSVAPMQVAPGLSRTPLDDAYQEISDLSGWHPDVFKYPSFARPQNSEDTFDSQVTAVLVANVFTPIAVINVPRGYEGRLLEYYCWTTAADFVATNTFQFVLNTNDHRYRISTIPGASRNRTTQRQHLILNIPSGGVLQLGVTATAVPTTVACEVYGFVAPVQGAGAVGSGRAK